MLRIISYIKKNVQKIFDKNNFCFFFTFFLNDRSFGINFDKFYFSKNFWLKKKLSTFWSQKLKKKVRIQKVGDIWKKVEECYYPLFLI